ncbi:MAG TPA: pseudaminic acid synthase [Steroidobacteraceae bacterium]
MIRIGKHEVGEGAPPFIIAEMSGNHNGSLSRALEIVDAIAASGAHALKLQTYTADTMTIDVAEREFVIRNPESPWFGRNLHALYEEAHTPWKWHKPLFQRAREHGLAAFSSAFDGTAVDFLESLDVPAFKIASFENRDLDLIRRVARTGKPVIISTGLATLAEIDAAVRAVHEAGGHDLVLLKCTSNYPADPSSSNLRTIPYLRDLYRCEVGLSDHTLGIAVATASVACGATVIEKHVTLDRASGGVDSTFSLEPPELKQLVESCRMAWLALGSVQTLPTAEEIPSLVFRRSLYVCTDLAAGDALTRENLRAIRPGNGLPPQHLSMLLGKRVNRTVPRGTPMSWDLIG